MGPDSMMHFIDTLGALLFVDVLLSGDNAMVIALACRSLPAEQRRRAMLIGTGGAMLLRIVLTSVAGFLLRVPLLKIVGGVLLLVIAIKLMLEEGDAGDDLADAAVTPDLWSAVTTVITADLIMSLDNVVGLAAVARDDVLMLSLGLAISMPLLMFGSRFFGTLMQRFPVVVPLGCAMLGWIGGDIAMSDALIADAINTQSPGLTVVVPVLMAIFVLLQARIIRSTAPGLQQLRSQLQRARSHTPAEPAPSMEAPAPAEPPAAALIKPESIVAAAPPPGMPRQWPLIRDALGLAVAVAAISTAVHFWMPQPSQLKTYVCPAGALKLQFHEGDAHVKLWVGQAYAEASLQSGGRLVWGELNAVSVALNMAPPTQLLVKDAQTVVLNGGDADHLSCVAPPAH